MKVSPYFSHRVVVKRRKGRLDKALRPRLPEAYSCSTSRKPTEHNESEGSPLLRRGAAKRRGGSGVAVEVM